MFEYMYFFKANIRTSFLSNFDSPSVCVCVCVCVCVVKPGNNDFSDFQNLLQAVRRWTSRMFCHGPPSTAPTYTLLRWTAPQRWLAAPAHCSPSPPPPPPPPLGAPLGAPSRGPPPPTSPWWRRSRTPSRSTRMTTSPPLVASHHAPLTKVRLLMSLVHAVFYGLYRCV